MVTDEMLKRAIEAYAKETGAEDWQLDGWINSAIRAALEAALSAAEPVEKDENPMRFFADKVDNWGALEWFNRMADACEDHDRKRRIISQCTDDEEKEILEISANTSKMVMTSSAFHLARECKDSVISALSAQVKDVAGMESNPVTLRWWCQQLLDIIENHDITHDSCDEEIAMLNDIRASVDPAAPAKQEG